MTGLPEREPWQRPELVLVVPERLVPAEFRDRVAAEIVEADRRARVSLPARQRCSSKAVPLPEPAAAPATVEGALAAYTAERHRRFLEGRCAECGIGWDDQTIGCHACDSRHAQRMIAADATAAER